MLRDKFRQIPVLAGRDRIKTVKEALARYGADTIILDDGFQHWRIGRDLDIVLIDATSPFGNRKLIPRGILREPLSSLTRADVFVLTKTNFAKEDLEALKKELQKYNCQAPIFEAVHLPSYLRSLTFRQRVELPTIKNKPVALVWAIANPQSFAESLELSGARIALRFYFPDHYQYGKEDLKRIERQCLENQIKTIITTEKDAPKLTSLLKCEKLKVEILALCIELRIVAEPERFFSLLINDKDTSGSYSILILSDGKAGHLNQSKAVARIIQKRKTALGVSSDNVNIKIVEVKFKNSFCENLLSFFSIFVTSNCRRALGCFRFCFKKDSFAELMQSAANIIISAGSSLSAVNLFLSYKNQARKVVLMKPSFLSLDSFDLIIVPEHDRVKPRDNILVTRIAPNMIDRQYLQEQANILKKKIEDSGFKVQPDGPKIGVLIGGDTDKYRMPLEFMERIIFQLKEAGQNLNCQILVTTSRRTSKTVEKLLKDNLGNFKQCKLLVIANEQNIPQAVGGILGLSDIIVVSGESISMVSEAVSAEKYVLAFIPEKKTKAVTKQERFLERLEKEAILKNIQADNLFSEIEKICQERPKRIKIEDREAIYQAVSRILQI